MELSAPTFRVKLAALCKANDEDWARVRVGVQTGGFAGDFEAWLQYGDIDSFSKQLRALYANVGQPGTARLECAERGISMILTMETLGGIDGQFTFFDENTSAVLSGDFKIDQSYIPEWRNAVDSLLDELRSHTT